MTRPYPNIELLEYITTKFMLCNHDSSKRFIPDYDVYVFPQTWPNTGGGMARKGFFYGDAMTKEYTTVFINPNEDAAVVCFSNRPAYMVKPISQAFQQDLAKRDMQGVDHTERYNNTCVTGYYDN